MISVILDIKVTYNSVIEGPPHRTALPGSPSDEAWTMRWRPLPVCCDKDARQPAGENLQGAATRTANLRSHIRGKHWTHGTASREGRKQRRRHMLVDIPPTYTNYFYTHAQAHTNTHKHTHTHTRTHTHAQTHTKHKNV